MQTDFVYNKEEILKNLQIKLTELKTASPLIEEGKRLSKSLHNDLKRYKNVNEEVLKSLKKLSMNYLTLSSDFANKSKMFDFIITADKIDLDYEMKMTQEFNFDSVSRINDKLSSFYENAQKHIIEIEGLINESIVAAG